MPVPIVLFVYGRPLHTLKTLESLSENILSDQSSLYIFADGPKKDCSPDTLINIEETRKIIRSKQWCKEVVILESQENKGLANSIVEGVTLIANKHGKVIVLEDDIITSPYFLTYMNDALNLYENNGSVMHISGYMYDIPNKDLDNTFFYQQTTCWGWGTWKNRWALFNPDAQDLYKKLEQKKLLKWFDLDGSGLFLSQLEMNINGKLKTWAIKWQASVCLNNGLCLHPRLSFTKNIGFDGSGINCLDQPEENEKQIAFDYEPLRPISTFSLNPKVRSRMVIYHGGRKKTYKEKLKEIIIRTFKKFKF